MNTTIISDYVRYRYNLQLCDCDAAVTAFQSAL